MRGKARDVLVVLAWGVLMGWAAACAFAAAAPPSAQGQWLGAIKTPGGELRVLFHIDRDAQGKYTATLDSVDQGARGIPVGDVNVSGKTLRIEVRAVGGRYEGTFSDDGKKVEGTWSQGGEKLPLVLTRTEGLPAPVRPQMPMKPYPYVEEEVAFDSQAAGVRFAGTLTHPQGQGPFPAVLLITGSGPQDRDETLMDHKPFLVLADYLTRRGLAVLRVDDRGVGGSTGDRSKATMEDFAGDARAAVTFLTSRKDIDPKRIGLLGHSEGALIADLVAAQSPEVAFAVRIGGPGVMGEEILYAQQRLILLAEGASKAVADKQEADCRRYYAIVKEEKDGAVATQRIRDLMQAEFEAYPEEQRKALGVTQETVDASAKMVTDQLVSPWFRFFLTYDPKPTLEKLKLPVLAVWGEKDLQVPPKQNYPAVAAALKEGGDAHVTLQVLPGLNHLLQTAKTGSPTEYAKTEETMSPAALQLIGDWMVEQTTR